MNAMLAFLFPLCLQTLGKLNPKLQSMVELIRANRVRWDELHRLRQSSPEGAETPDCCANDPPTTVATASSSCVCTGQRRVKKNTQTIKDNM